MHQNRIKRSKQLSKSKKDAESHFNRFKDMLKHIVSVPKSEIDKREKEYQKQRAKIRKSKTRVSVR